MNDLCLLTNEQLAKLDSFFLKSHDKTKASTPAFPAGSNTRHRSGTTSAAKSGEIVS